jgi:hypothetical protein
VSVDVPVEGFVYDDGGRAAAGFRGSAGDCVCRAIAIVGKLPYAEVYGALNAAGKRERRRDGRRSSARTGVYKETSRRWLMARGWTWTPAMGIGTGCLVHLRKDELPSGRIVVQLSHHLAAVVDGVVHDTSDPSRGGTRCVYGWWRPPEQGG